MSGAGVPENHFKGGVDIRDLQSQTVVEALFTDAGFRGVSGAEITAETMISVDRQSPASPQGDAILINGLVSGQRRMPYRCILANPQGATNCSGPNIPDLSLPCNPPPPAEIEVPVGKRVRVRLLNTGSFGMFRVSIDQHPFELVEADDTAVWGPSGLHEVSVSTAQRASIIINTDQGDVGSGYFLRARFVEGKPYRAQRELGG
jgi:hypothetical protein